MSRVALYARKSARIKWKRVGRHRRSGRFVWLGSAYAKVLDRRGLLLRSIAAEDLAEFNAWASRKQYLTRTADATRIQDKLIATAAREVGVTEQPLGSNRGPRVDYYRRATTLWPSLQTGWPWCSAFVVRMCIDAGIRLPKAARTASVWHFTEWAEKNKLIANRAPRKGDIVVLFGAGQHIGFCARSSMSSTVSTIEGNTTPLGAAGSAYEGTAVARQARDAGHVVVVIDIARWHHRQGKK